MRRTRLLVPICLLGGLEWLCGCQPPASRHVPPPPAPPRSGLPSHDPARTTLAQAAPSQASPSQASPSGASLSGAGAFSETTVQQDGVPVTSLSYDSRVFFDSDQDRPRPEAAPVLDALASRLEHPPGAHVAVLGHTDAVGSDAYNLALSRRRAVMVVRALVARGVDPATLDPVAVGKRQPIASDDSEAGRARNRRVEFLISSSPRAIDALIASRPDGSLPQARHPAALHLHVRQPDAVTRAPLGDPVPY